MENAKSHSFAPNTQQKSKDTILMGHSKIDKDDPKMCNLHLKGKIADHL